MQHEEFLLAWELVCHLGNSVNQERLFLFLWNVNYGYIYFQVFVLLQGTKGALGLGSCGDVGAFANQSRGDLASRPMQIKTDACDGFAWCGANSLGQGCSPQTPAAELQPCCPELSPGPCEGVWGPAAFQQLCLSRGRVIWGRGRAQGDVY